MSWNGVKQQVNKVEIEAWCEEMDIKYYTINSKGEIDVDGRVDIGFLFLNNKTIEELPYKFGRDNGSFDLSGNTNLTSLKNCPNIVTGNFRCSGCSQLDSLEGCPKEVSGDFWCNDCKRKFTKEEVMSLCKVKGEIVV